MEKQPLTFGDMRGLVSRNDRVSVLFDDMSYVNYPRIGEVPGKYDHMELKGFGIVESEFPVEGDLWPAEARENGIGNGMFYGRCIEFWVSGGPSAHSVRRKLASASSELELLMEGLPDGARDSAKQALRDMGRALGNLDDIVGELEPEARRRAAEGVE